MTSDVEKAAEGSRDEDAFKAGAEWMFRQLYGVCSGRIHRYGKVETLRELMKVGEKIMGEEEWS